MLNLQTKTEFSEPGLGKAFNQDCIGSSKNGVWLLDGISELTVLDLPTQENVVVWFVNQISEYLKENLDRTDLTLEEILSTALNHTKKKFQRLSSTDVTTMRKVDHPSATIVVVRLNNDHLELLALGNSVIYLQSRQQELLIQNYVARDRDQRFFHETIRERSKYPKLTHLEFLDQIKLTDRLKSFRATLYQRNRYIVLNLDPSLIAKGFTCNIPCKPNTKILLLSDGFTRAIDTYHLYPDYHTLLLTLENGGVEPIYRNIREVEQDDPDARKFPRLRISDDASLLYAICA